MEELKGYTAYIENHLGDVDIPDAPKDLYDPIRYVLGIGGKRIRPILTLLAAEMFGSTKEQSIHTALAIEVFHNFTLIHDDIMDQAPLRRNQPTVHHKWNENVAILTGDVMMIQAYQLLCKMDPEKLPSALEVFNSTAISVCEGQQLDMDFEGRTNVTIHEYIEMIRLKTSVLLGCALQLGALIAGADEKDQKEVFNFGQHIGIAFQIKDDILDLYGQSYKFGKQIGGDVIANKKTILHLTAQNKANPQQIEVSKQLLNLDNIEQKVQRTKELFDHLDVKSDCYDRMSEHLDHAKMAMSKISVSDAHKKPLLDLADYLMNRDI